MNKLQPEKKATLRSFFISIMSNPKKEYERIAKEHGIDQDSMFKAFCHGYDLVYSNNKQGIII